MKNIILPALFICMAACSCSREYPDKTGTSAIRVEVDSKSSSDYSGRSRQLLLFNSSGRLAWGRNGGGNALIRTRPGSGYTLVALDGCPDAFSNGTPTLDYVLDLPVSLSEWNSPDTGFASAAVARDITLGTGETAVTLSVRRLVCRIILRSITLEAGSGLDGAVLDNVFLSNAVACRTPAGARLSWANPAGRGSSDPSHVIDGGTYPADCPALTFHHWGAILREGRTLVTDRDFYCYPNVCSEPVSGYGGDTGRPCTRLVVALRIAGHTYYYPVNLPDLQENCSYGVSLKLKNLGSDDPDRPVSSAVLQASVTMSEWAFGKEFITNLSNQIKL